MGETGRSNMISAPVMMQVNETKHLKEVVDSDCVCALLSLASPRSVASSPKSSRSRDSLAEPVESRPVKMLKRQDSREQVCRVGGVASSKGVEQPTLQPGAEAMLNRWVELKRGKYKGRSALIVGMTAKKFRVRVTGVELQLEFYPSMFKEIEAGRLSPAQTSVSIPTPAKQPTPARTVQPTPASAEPVKTVVVPESSQIIVAKPVRRLPPQLQRKLNPPKLHLLSDQKVTTCRDGQLTLDIISPGPRIAAV